MRGSQKRRLDEYSQELATPSRKKRRLAQRIRDQFPGLDDDQIRSLKLRDRKAANRVSAKKSRENRKKEFDTLAVLSAEYERAMAKYEDSLPKQKIEFEKKFGINFDNFFVAHRRAMERAFPASRDDFDAADFFVDDLLVNGVLMDPSEVPPQEEPDDEDDIEYIYDFPNMVDSIDLSPETVSKCGSEVAYQVFTALAKYHMAKDHHTARARRIVPIAHQTQLPRRQQQKSRRGRRRRGPKQGRKGQLRPFTNRVPQWHLSSGVPTKKPFPPCSSVSSSPPSSAMSMTDDAPGCAMMSNTDLPPQPLTHAGVFPAHRGSGRLGLASHMIQPWTESYCKTTSKNNILSFSQWVPATVWHQQQVFMPAPMGCGPTPMKMEDGAPLTPLPTVASVNKKMTDCRSSPTTLKNNIPASWKRIRKKDD